MITLKATIYSARSDRDGSWRLTLEIPSDQATLAAALATMTETVFKIEFTPEEGV